MGAKTSRRSFFRGLVIGSVLGAATAMLIAPQSGEETRTRIKEKGSELKEKAETTYADVTKRVEAATADLRGRIDELSAKMDEFILKARGDLSRKVGGPAEESIVEELVVKEA
jgi:gas vesicle protein